MKRITKGLLMGSMLAALSFQVEASTNKTSLAARPVGVNLAMELPTWHTQINKRIHEMDENFGASMQTVGFYEESTNDDDLGKVFGFGDANKLTVGAAGAGISIDRVNLMKGANALAGTINLEAKHRAYGARLDFQQDLDCLWGGLYLKLSSAVAVEENQMSLNVANETKQGDKGIVDYFAGNYAVTDVQSTLKYAKMDGNKHRKAGLSDIDVQIGWNFYETRRYHAGLNIGAVFPTAPKRTAKYVFESLAGGNGGHYGLGAGLDAKAMLWDNDGGQALSLSAKADWRYLFKANEKRTLGLNGQNWGQYLPVGTLGVKALDPLANISTMDVKVKPGNYVDVAAMLSYMNCGLKVDLGYNFFFKEKEVIDKKSVTLTDGKYGLAGGNYAPGTAAYAKADNVAVTNTNLIADAIDGANAAFLAATDFDVTTAQTPRVMTHNVFAGVGYVFEEWRTPLVLGISGNYEFTDKTDKSIEKWGVQARIGLSF